MVLQQTECKCNVVSLIKAHSQDLLIFEISAYPAACMRLKSDFLAIPKKVLHISHTPTENIMIRYSCFSFIDG